MSFTRVNTARFEEFVTLVSHISTHKQSHKFQGKLNELIGFDIGELSHDFIKKSMDYLVDVLDKPLPDLPEFDFNKGDDLPDSMKKEHTQKTASAPLEIWIEVKGGITTTAKWAELLRDSGWDFIDHRNVRSPLQMTPERVRELLNEQIVDEKMFADYSPATRGLLELVMKAFLNWWETKNNSNPQPKKFGEL